MTTTLAIPRAIPVPDLAEFEALALRNQERVRQLLDAIELIHSAPSLSAGYALAVSRHGISAATLRRVESRWRAARGDWRALINRAYEWRPNEKLPEAFVREVQRRVDDQNRSVESALKRLRTDWTLGKPIPGYGTWRDHWMRQHPHRSLPANPPGHPAGWSTRNLRRLLDRSKFRAVAQQRGLTAAKKHRPGLKQSRVGCPVGHIIQWDDLEHDFFVNDFGHEQAVRPLELFAHDYASAFKAFWGCAPKWKDDAGYTKKLSGGMMRLIVAGYFYQHGYLPEVGTICVAEHGTAAFSEDMRRILFDATAGAITVSDSGFDGRAPHAGLYHGPWRGQPGHKASLESSNNLAHNRTAHFPGQTGPNVERRPDHLHGALKHNAQLIAAMKWMPAEYREQLQMDFLEYSQGMRLLAEVYHQIASDRDHKVEGWLQCGHVLQAIEFAGNFMLLHEVPPAERQKVTAYMQAGIISAKPVLKNRWEVWNEGRAHLRPITGGTVCKILGDAFMKERRVRGHAFSLESQWMAPGLHHYWGHVITPDGHREELTEGETYQIFVNPFAPDQLFVRDAKARYLGIAPAQPIAHRHDPDSVTAAVREYATEENRLVSKLVKRQLPNIAKRRDRHKHNAAVLKAHLDAKQNLTAEATAALDASLPAEETQPHDDHENTTLHYTDW